MINVNLELLRKLINNLPCFGKRKLYYHSLNYHPGTFISLAMLNSRRLFILRRVFKPEKRKGRFIKENIGIFHLLNKEVFVNIE